MGTHVVRGMIHGGDGYLGTYVVKKDFGNVLSRAYKVLLFFFFLSHYSRAGSKPMVGL